MFGFHSGENERPLRPETAGRILEIYDHLLMVDHPYVSNRERGHKQFERLEKFDHGLNIEWIESSPDRFEMQAMVEERLTDRTIVGMRTGDGSLEGALRAVLGKPSAIWKKRVGNGDNMGRASFPYFHRSNPKHILMTGRVASAKAVECTITHENGEVESYIVPDLVGVGDTGAGAAAIDEPAHRQKRNQMHPLRQLVFDARKVSKAIDNNPAFKVEIDGEILELNEILIANLGTIARIGRLPIQLEEPRMLRTEVSYESRLQARLHAVRLLSGRIATEDVYTGQSVNFTVQSQTVWQAGGNAHQLQPGDQVEVKHTEQSFNYLTTRPPLTRSTDAY